MADEMEKNEARYAREMAEEKRQDKSAFKETFQQERSPSIEPDLEARSEEYLKQQKRPEARSVSQSKAPSLPTPQLNPRFRDGELFVDAPDYTPVREKPQPLNESEKGPTSERNKEGTEHGGHAYPPGAPGGYHHQTNTEAQSEDRANGVDQGDAFGHDSNDDDEIEMDELEGGLTEHAFHHPALYKHQPVVSDGDAPGRRKHLTLCHAQIWLPQDALGISDEAVRNARALRINITSRDATIDAKGKIQISRSSIPGTDHDQ